MDDAPRLEAFGSLNSVSISQLSPSLNPLDQRYLYATVILLWPYSSATEQFSLLLSEPDFRLRGVNGQVKVNFRGKAAEAVASSKVGIGDNVYLALDGAELKAREHGALNTVQGIEWDLLFCNKVLLEVHRESELLSSINLEPSPSGTPQHAEVPVPQSKSVAGIPNLAPSIDSSWSSPIFTKTADTIFPTTVFGHSADDDGFVLGKGRKRTKFSRPSSDWIFVDAPPSPVKGTEIWEDGELDAEQSGSSVVESPSNEFHAASPCPNSMGVERPEIPSLSIDISENQIPEFDFQLPPQDDGVGNASLGVNGINYLEGHAAFVKTPRLQPIPSPGMPIVSPMVGSLTPSTDYFTHPAASKPAQPDAHNLSNTDLAATGVTNISTHDGGTAQAEADSLSGLDTRTAQDTPFNDFQEPSSSTSPTSPASHSVTAASPHREHPVQTSFDISTPREDGMAFMLGGIIDLEEEDSDTETFDGVKVPETLGENGYLSGAAESDYRLQSQWRSHSSIGESSSSIPEVSPSLEIHETATEKVVSNGDKTDNEIVVLDEDTGNSDIESESSAFGGQFFGASESPGISQSSSQRWSNKPQFQDHGSMQPTITSEGSVQSESAESGINRDGSIDATPRSPDFKEVESPRSGSDVSSSSRAPTDKEASDIDEVTKNRMDSENSRSTSFPADLGFGLDGTAEAVDSPFVRSDSKLQQQTIHQLITPSNTQGSLQPLIQETQLMRRPSAELPTPEFSQETEIQLSFLAQNTATETGVSAEIDIQLPTCSLPEIRAADVELETMATPAEYGTPDLPLIENEVRTPEMKSPILRATSILATDSPETSLPASSRQASLDRYSITESAVETSIEPQMKPPVSGLRTTLSYYCPLSRLVEHFNRTTDTISVVAGASPISRAEGAPKHFYVTLQVTDRSLPGSTTPVQIFHPEKEKLPPSSNGDIVLLRNFRVQSFNHSMMLNGVSESAWANFTQGKFDDVQVNGVPVEYSAEEGDYVASLHKWYEEEGATLVEKHRGRRKEPSLRMSSVSASESGSQSSPGPKNIFRRHRRKSRRATTSPRITVHELRHGRRYLDLGSPSDKESIHELRDGTVYAHP